MHGAFFSLQCGPLVILSLRPLLMSYIFFLGSWSDHLRDFDRRNRQIELSSFHRPLHRRPRLHPPHGTSLCRPTSPPKEVTIHIRRSSKGQFK